MNFGIIGAGVVGTAIAIRLEQAGHRFVGVQSRSEDSLGRFSRYLHWEWRPLEEWIREADIVFITTQDGMIRSVAKELTDRAQYRPGQVWIHCSGSMRAKALQIDERIPVKYLSLHPLQSFASIDQAVTLFQGTHFGVEGDVEELGEEIVVQLGGIPHRLAPDKKPLYHAGAVIASNYLVTIAALAVRLFEQAGIEKTDALESLLPLMQGTLRNLEKVGLPQALTGPIARGDIDVIRSHLKEMPAKLQPVYRALGLYTLEIGLAKKEANGLEYPQAVWEEMKRLFE